MLEKAVRICDAAFGNIYRWDGRLLNLVAAHNTPSACGPVSHTETTSAPKTVRQWCAHD